MEHPRPRYHVHQGSASSCVLYARVAGAWATGIIVLAEDSGWGPKFAADGRLQIFKVLSQITTNNNEEDRSEDDMI